MKNVLNENVEKVFDIEEYVLKATAFHKDKDRAEKLSKTKNKRNFDNFFWKRAKSFKI